MVLPEIFKTLSLLIGHCYHSWRRVSSFKQFCVGESSSEWIEFWHHYEKKFWHPVEAKWYTKTLTNSSVQDILDISGDKLQPATLPARIEDEKHSKVFKVQILKLMIYLKCCKHMQEFCCSFSSFSGSWIFLRDSSDLQVVSACSWGSSTVPGRHSASSSDGDWADSFVDFRMVSATFPPTFSSFSLCTCLGLLVLPLSTGLPDTPFSPVEEARWSALVLAIQTQILERAWATNSSNLFGLSLWPWEPELWHLPGLWGVVSGEFGISSTVNPSSAAHFWR